MLLRKNNRPALNVKPHAVKVSVLALCFLTEEFACPV